jgi:hypothetical protein
VESGESLLHTETAIQEFVQHTAWNEPGLCLYIAMQEEKDKTLFSLHDC